MSFWSLQLADVRAGIRPQAGWLHRPSSQPLQSSSLVAGMLGWRRYGRHHGTKRKEVSKVQSRRTRILWRSSVLSTYSNYHEHFDSQHIPACTLMRNQISQTHHRTNRKLNVAEKITACLGKINIDGAFRLPLVIMPVIFPDTSHTGGGVLSEGCLILKCALVKGHHIGKHEEDTGRVWDVPPGTVEEVYTPNTGKQDLEGVRGSVHSLEEQLCPQRIQASCLVPRLCISKADYFSLIIGAVAQDRMEWIIKKSSKVPRLLGRSAEVR